MLAACALWIHGEPPLLLDMRAVRDFDHVVALFRRHGRWGAISKTNGIGLRWRDPVYGSLRELAMSYFHEYTNRATTRRCATYSVPYDLRRMKPEVWVTGEKNAWDGGRRRSRRLRHFKLIDGRHLRGLMRRDPFERESAACCSTAAARCWRSWRSNRRTAEAPQENAAEPFLYFSSTLPIFSSAILRRAASFSQ